MGVGNTITVTVQGWTNLYDGGIPYPVYGPAVTQTFVLADGPPPPSNLYVTTAWSFDAGSLEAVVTWDPPSGISPSSACYLPDFSDAGGGECIDPGVTGTMSLSVPITAPGSGSTTYTFGVSSESIGEFPDGARSSCPSWWDPPRRSPIPRALQTLRFKQREPLRSSPHPGAWRSGWETSGTRGDSRSPRISSGFPYNIDIYARGSNGQFTSGASMPVGQIVNGVGNDAGAPSVVVADFNHDGNADIAAAGCWGLTLYRGLSNGGFSFPPTFVDAGGCLGNLTEADLNLDGNLDLVASLGSTVAIFIGDGDGGFSQGSFGVSVPPSGLGIGDFNGDGIPDLAIAAGPVGDRWSARSCSTRASETVGSTPLLSEPTPSRWGPGAKPAA